MLLQRAREVQTVTLYYMEKRGANASNHHFLMRSINLKSHGHKSRGFCDEQI
jgi:hypothetical protein